MNPRRWLPRLALAMLVLSALVGTAQAATRAWLDRSAIALGEPVTLNIETDQRSVVPDYAPLRGGFSLSDESSSRQVQVVNGAMTVRWLFGVLLTPRQPGELTIPVLRVGGEATLPLRLSVVAAQDATPSSPRGAHGNAEAFVETVVDDRQPYVQQSVGVLVRLYFATQLASGELELEQPEGASLQRIGDDISSVKTIEGRQYNVVERRFLLVPERSGALTLPGAHFSGRAAGGFFDGFFDRASDALNARSSPQTLQVRAQPDAAPQPWLPLHDLRLRYTSSVQQATAGQAVALRVEATVVGATQAQFPELPIPAVADAQVFAEPAQYEERFAGGTPQLTLTRRYSIVPTHAGVLVVPGLRMDWWDVAAGTARQTRLPDLTLQVAAGSGGFATAAPAQTAATALVDSAAASGTPDDTARPWGWIGLSGLFALLWLATLGWGLWLRRRSVPAAPPVGSMAATPTAAQPNLSDLRRALDGGGLDEVARTLCAMGRVDGLDQLVARLDTVPQREAIMRLQRARWAGEGDLSGARQALREAFRQGPRWRVAETTPVAQDLEPLYPR